MFKAHWCEQSCDIFLTTRSFAQIQNPDRVHAARTCWRPQSLSALAYWLRDQRDCHKSTVLLCNIEKVIGCVELAEKTLLLMEFVAPILCME